MEATYPPLFPKALPMLKTLLSATLLTCAAGPCLAAPPFTCSASGDAWIVEGAPTHKMSCTFRCILRDGSGGQDVVSCAPTVAPGSRGGAVCEGFLLGKHWTGAALVAAECATVD